VECLPQVYDTGTETQGKVGYHAFFQSYATNLRGFPMRFLSIATLFLCFAGPVSAEIYPIKEGDVFCTGYDKSSNSCSSVQTIKIVDEGKYLILDLAGFAFGETRLDMIASMEAIETEGKICLAPGTINIAITPKEAAIAEGWQNLMQYQLDDLASQGYCFEHRKCSDTWAAIAWVADEERRDLSATFEVFEADDPRSETAQPRYLNIQEKDKAQKELEDKCFGKEA
jgi:hypothetical protein